MKKILLPEIGCDARVEEAASLIVQEGIAEIVTLDVADAVRGEIHELLDASKYFNSEQEQSEVFEDPIALSFCLLKLGYADAVICGAAQTTAHVVRMGLRIVGVEEGVKTVASAFLMKKDAVQYIFADCAVNISPSAEQLKDIALSAAEATKHLGEEPRIGMLSFVTGESDLPAAAHVAEAVQLLKQNHSAVSVVGPVQFDAAFDEGILQKKMPDISEEKLPINTFVFPDLSSGNIGYKIAERLGGYRAIGPIILGLKKEVYDLSRGCSTQDIVDLAIYATKKNS